MKFFTLIALLTTLSPAFAQNQAHNAGSEVTQDLQRQLLTIVAENQLEVSKGPSEVARLELQEFVQNKGLGQIQIIEQTRPSSRSMNMIWSTQVQNSNLIIFLNTAQWLRLTSNEQLEHARGMLGVSTKRDRDGVVLAPRSSAIHDILQIK